MVVRMEFDYYDWGSRGSLAAVDFARSLVATADVKATDKLMDRVSGPELPR